MKEHINNKNYPLWVVAVDISTNYPELTRWVKNENEESETISDFNKILGTNYKIEYSKKEPFLGW